MLCIYPVLSFSRYASPHACDLKRIAISVCFPGIGSTIYRLVFSCVEVEKAIDGHEPRSDPEAR